MPIPGVAWLMGLGVNAAIAYLLLAVCFVIVAQPLKLIAKLFSFVGNKLANSRVACMVLGLTLAITLGILGFMLAK